MFEELVATLEKPPAKERPENAWVRPGTLSLVDRKAELRKVGRLTQREACRLARAIRVPSARRSIWTGNSRHGRRAKPS